MIKKILPNRHVKDVFEITPEELKAQGIKGIITDLDNTLVAWDVADATDQVIEWFKMMADNNIKVTIISNNNQDRVRVFSEPLNTPFIYSARKPLGKAFKKATKQMGLKREEIVVMGDQLFTDVLGGNIGGFYTVLVVPVAKTDGKFTKINRMMEKRLLDWMRRRGKISWEE